jgi:hypothetical protein
MVVVWLASCVGILMRRRSVWRAVVLMRRHSDDEEVCVAYSCCPHASAFR